MIRRFAELRSFLLTFTTLSSVVVSGCSFFSFFYPPERANTNSAETAEAVVAITVGRTEAREVPAVVQATGSMVADESSNVAPKIAGKVADIAVNAGDFVSSGTFAGSMIATHAYDSLRQKQA